MTHCEFHDDKGGPEGAHEDESNREEECSCRAFVVHFVFLIQLIIISQSSA